MNLRTALGQGAKLLEKGGIGAPRLTAEVLLSHALRRDRLYLFTHPEEELTELGWIHYGRYLHERLQGKPTQYITQRQEFYGREFRVTRDVLIPRPETEHLVEEALAVLGPGQRVVDVGCGSGAIAVTLALESRAVVFAADISAPALRVARENAERLGATVAFLQGDLVSGFAAGTLDAVVSNPPYVGEDDVHALPPEVRDWEPPVALFAGASGLEIYRRLIADSCRVLRRGGWFAAELGFRLEPAVREMLAGWRDVRTRPDLAGIPRVITAVKP